MRALMLVAGAALTLAACGNNDQSDNTANVDENFAAESTVSNDVTAIDAVTGDASNMAADVNYSNNLDNDVGNDTGNMSAPTAAPKPRPRTRPAEATASNATANASGNSAD